MDILIDSVSEGVANNLKNSTVAGYECMRAGRKRLDATCMLLHRLALRGDTKSSF